MAAFLYRLAGSTEFPPPADFPVSRCSDEPPVLQGDCVAREPEYHEDHKYLLTRWSGPEKSDGAVSAPTSEINFWCEQLWFPRCGKYKR
jgi:hypothetical protein